MIRWEKGCFLNSKGNYWRYNSTKGIVDLPSVEILYPSADASPKVMVCSVSMSDSCVWGSHEWNSVACVQQEIRQKDCMGHRTTEQMKWEGRSGDHLVQSSFSYSKFLRAVSCWVLSISRNGDSATSLDSFWRCLTTLTVKKKNCFVLVFKWNFLYFGLCPFSLVLPLGTTEKGLVLSSLLSGIYPDWWDSSEPSLL